MTAPIAAPAQRLQSVWDKAQDQEDALRRRRQEPPLVRLWDGDWVMVGRVAGEMSGEFRWTLNNSGTGTVVLPADHYLAQWAVQFHNRKRNVHITCDKDGARWSGRLQKISVKKTDSGERTCTLTFLHDYEELKHLLVWANPVLPAAVQFPRAFTLAGPSVWALKLAMFLNLMRNQNSLFTLPDNPLDFGQWGGSLDMRNWPIVVRGGDVLADRSPHAIISSRFKTWHDLAAPILADAQLMVTCDRWLEGDPEPWPGYRPREGQLVIDIVDKSDWWGATGTTGNVLQGILTTVMQLADNLVDIDRAVVDDPNDGFRPGDWLGTAPGTPWVVYREGELTGVQSSEWTYQPATDVQIVVGGHSMPGINEAISSAIQLAGDLASSTFIGPNVNLGQIADTVLKPIYSDTLLAWMSFKSFQRAQELGWSHYYEHIPQGADRAYTLSSLMAIRKGWWETREKVSHTVKVGDGAPYLIGANGGGDFFLGDRIATALPEMAGDLVVDQVTECTFAWDRSKFGWDVTVGHGSSSDSSGLEQLVKTVSSAVTAAKELGVV